MIHRGVRMLLVVDDLNSILGLITASDLTSEKPMQVVQTQGIRHADVMVKDIMTPRERLEVLCMEDVRKARVGDIVHTLKTQGRQHALVVDRAEDRSQVLRGMFSVSQISRQLGATLETAGVAHTFAELGAELGR
jgi:CBS domain containing-hemolysin-like protein